MDQVEMLFFKKKYIQAGFLNSLFARGMWWCE